MIIRKKKKNDFCGSPFQICSNFIFDNRGSGAVCRGRERNSVFHACSNIFILSVTYCIGYILLQVHVAPWLYDRPDFYSISSVCCISFVINTS